VLERWLAVVALACALPAQAAIHSVTIEGMHFTPAVLKVHRGDTVVWINRDFVPHTATAKQAFDSGPIAPNGRWSFVARRAGRHEVKCTLHPTMTSELTIE
jgi:plastocyanin